MTETFLAGGLLCFLSALVGLGGGWVVGLGFGLELVLGVVGGAPRNVTASAAGLGDVGSVAGSDSAAAAALAAACVSESGAGSDICSDVASDNFSHDDKL